MTSVPSEGKKLISGRATEDEIKVIDLGATLRKQDRQSFLVQAALETAKRLIETETPQLLERLRETPAA